MVLKTETKRTSLLKISGNILYDVNYRSRIDTPYAETDVYQHTLQTRIDAVYKDKYPFRMYLTTRFGNSDLFRKYTDLNFQFNQSDFKRMLKTSAMNAIEQYVNAKTGRLDSLRKIIDERKAAIAALRHSTIGSDPSQKIIEEREKALFEKRSKSEIPADNFEIDEYNLNSAIGIRGKIKIPDAITDSIQKKKEDAIGKADIDLSKYHQFKDSIETKKGKLDSLIKELEIAESLYRKIKSATQLDADDLKKQVEGSTDINSLVGKLREAGIPDSVLPKGYKTLSAVQTFSIGRSTADYSELSVRNISISGIQVEYNPRYYYAVAAGKVNYRFQDYIVSNHTRSNQFLALARFGKGTRNGNHVFFTYYTGKRQYFNSAISSQPGYTIPEYKLAGITVEALYKISRNISVIGEIAKSTVPYQGGDSLMKARWMNSVTNFNDRSNEAYSIKAISFFPKTQTRLSGNVRYTGAHFQSFSTFTTGASQLRWAARLEQPFFKRKLTILSSVQQNDYYNPFVAINYKTSALLASFQANLRIKKWPIISLGYYPSYQLIKTGDDKFSESRYYTLSGSAGYFYKIQEVQLSSYLVYSRFL